jgi:putative hydrolase of the HAD superfamily
MLFFDLDDTLMDHSAAERAAAIEFGRDVLDSKASEIEFYRTWRSASEASMRCFFSGEMSFEEQRKFRLELILDRNLNKRDAIDLFEQYLTRYRSHWSLFPDAVPALENLSEILKLGLITNGDATQQLRKIEQLSLSNYFSIIVISSQVKAAKPDLLIFEHAAKRAGVSAQECIYVGDNLETDAIAARNAGYRGIWINRHARSSQSENQIEMVRTLAELPSLLRATSARI